jgi:hypothetical protein
MRVGPEFAEPQRLPHPLDKGVIFRRAHRAGGS